MWGRVAELGHPECDEGPAGWQQAQAPLRWAGNTCLLPERLVKGKARQAARCAGEGAAVAFLRPRSVRAVCSAGPNPCLLLSVALIRDLRHGRARITFDAPNGICIDKADCRLDHQGRGGIQELPRPPRPHQQCQANSPLLEIVIPRRGPQRDTWGFVILPRNYYSLAFSFCYVLGLLLGPKVDVRFSQLLLSQAGTSTQAVSALNCGAGLPPWQAKHLEQSQMRLRAVQAVRGGHRVFAGVRVSSQPVFECAARLAEERSSLLDLLPEGAQEWFLFCSSSLQ